MGFLDLFSTDFKKAIPALAKENNWTVTEVSDNRAVFEFVTAAGHNQTLYILKYANTLEFSVPSVAKYAQPEAIPAKLAHGLLQRNHELPMGFWALEEIQGQWVFSVMHNEELARLHVENFSKIVTALVNECDHFEH